MVLYAFHQFEKHGHDVYGRRYHFIHYFDSAQPLGIEMTPWFVTFINIQLSFGFYVWYSEKIRQSVVRCRRLWLMCHQCNCDTKHIGPSL